MFDTLTNTQTDPTSQPSAKAVAKKSRAKAALAAEKLYTAASNIRLAYQRMRSTSEDYRDLRIMRQVIATEGLSRTLLMLCPLLGRLSAAIPAVESLDAVPWSPNDPRVKQACEDLEVVSEGEATAVVSWMDNVSANLDEMFHGLNDQLEEMIGTIGGLITDLSGMSVEVDDLKGAAVTAISADAALARLDILLQVIPKLDIPNAYDDGNKDKLQADFSEIAGLLGPIAGTFNEEFYLHIDTDRIDQKYIPVDSNLDELGYTVDRTIEVLNKASELVGALHALSDLHPQFMERLRSQSEAVKSDTGTADTSTTDAGTDTSAQPTAIPAATTEPAPVAQPVVPAVVIPAETPTTTEPTPATEDNDAGTEPTSADAAETAQAVDMLRTVVSAYLSIMLVAVEASVGALNRVVSISDEVEDLLEDTNDYKEPDPDPNEGLPDPAATSSDTSADTGTTDAGSDGGSDGGGDDTGGEEVYNPLAAYQI